ncbi:hypothetical protein R3I94_011703 [Phoxinus phoxinus]
MSSGTVIVSDAQRGPVHLSPLQIQPVVHSRIIVPARWKRISNESCTINVFTNGDISVPPARALIPKHTHASWENVLAMVTEKVHLRTGAVHRLCMLGSLYVERMT